MTYLPEKERYSSMKYNRCGKSGIKLPLLTLGFWHNFGGTDVYENGRAIVRKAFDLGITHFDLANNYGPPYGSAEETFGRIFKADFKPYRDEMIIATKAGYDMWPGPYGDKGSKKYLVASLDQSLKRMGLEYVDIFYHHRPDPETPIEETMAALDLIVRQGKALYVGISNYNPSQTEEAIRVLKQLGTPCLIHQARYSMADRLIEHGLQRVLEKENTGVIAFCPLNQGLLTDKYLGGVPADSRAAGNSRFLNSSNITEDMLVKIRKLNDVAASRGQSLAQMALAWVLRNGRVTSAIIGASKVKQVEDNVAALNNLEFSGEELQNIDDILK
ncbi:MAG TPA: L-glyceraldehyde 3-phosphate reductase [Clostridium sp.]|uniref:L-glyceraldehyde 3-phosphate reductase n=1 Tax=Clostridium sp. TaxID=1506 RepID=UPI002F93C44C